MTITKETKLEEKHLQGDEEINLLDYFIVILKRKKIILCGTLCVVLAVTIIVFTMSNKFQAEVRFLPPPQSSSSNLASAMLSSLGVAGVSGLAGSLLGGNAPGDMYVGLLNSRTVLDKIIDRFDLMTRYKTWINRILPYKREDCRKKLTSNIMFAETDDKSGIVSLAILDEDPKVAADMANSFLNEMEHLYKFMAVTEASKRKLFYEGQLKAAKENLANAENDMKNYQEKTGVLQVDAQAQAVIQGDAALRAQIAAKEVEINVMKTFSTAQNPDMQKAEEALRGMKAQLAKLEVKSGGGADPLMPTGRMPAVGMEYVRKLRDLKFYEALYELLIKQYEMAKLDEVKDIVVVQEVDRAVVPTKPAKPKRLLIIVLSIFIGLFLSVIAAFVMEMKEKVFGNPNNKERMDLLRKYWHLRRKDKSSTVDAQR